MRRLGILAASLSLSLSLAWVAPAAMAQDTGTKSGHDHANRDTAPATTDAGPSASDNGDTVVYGDINTGPGNYVIDVAPPDATSIDNGDLRATNGTASTLGGGNASSAPGTITQPKDSVLGPDGTYTDSESPPSSVTMGGDTAYVPSEPAPAEPAADAPVDTTATDAAPVDETATDAAPADTTAADTAAAPSEDLDGDNEPDALEADLGLDPTNIDTDGDGVADGDELKISGTDPTLADTDGDGLNDGDELYNYHTDPLNWDTDGDGTGDGVEVLTDSTDPLVAATGDTSTAAESSSPAAES